MRKPLLHIAFLFILMAFRLPAQDLLLQSRSFGLNAGAQLAFGTHFHRFGICLNVFAVSGRFQFNSEARAYFSFRNLGPPGIYPELVLSQGIVGAYGDKNTWFNPFLNSVSNQTGFRNSLAYSYNLYLNRIRSSQVTGLLSLQFGGFSFITENDILAKPILDRFRTGAVLVQYQHRDQFQAAINCTMWTGKMGRTVQSDKFPYGCYMDTTEGVYTRYSHGLLSAQFRYHAGASQIFQANAGIDAEQVRNVLQNKIIHDLAFLPRQMMRRNNCHIPMLDENGDQFLFGEGQKLRKPRGYFNLFSNPSVFY